MQRVLDGRYQVEQLLGSGGMARVWQARDLRLDRPVAIKELSVDELLAPAAQERFDREARAIARLSHPNIVSVYDFGSADGHSYLAMELVEGPTLARRLRDGPLPLSDAVAAAAQICDGLAAAHAAGIIHRDIKPANLILTPTGVVKICDFGVVRLLDGAPQANLTGSSEAMGSPNYMAPEQIKGGAIGPATDLYALGCTMYALITGGPPFTGDSPVAIAHQHLTARPEPLRARRPDVPAEVETLVAELLAKKPEDRPSSAALVRQRIAALEPDPVLAGASVPRSAAPTALVSPAAGALIFAQAAGGPVDRSATPPVPPRHGGRSRFAVWAAVAAALAMLAVLAVLLFTLRPGPQGTSAGPVADPTGAPTAVVSPSAFRSPSAVAATRAPANPPARDSARPSPPTTAPAPPPADPIAALRQSIRQQVETGNLAEKAGEDLQSKVNELAKAIAADDEEGQAKKLRELQDKLDSLYEGGKLTPDGYRVLDSRVDAVAAVVG